MTLTGSATGATAEVVAPPTPSVPEWPAAPPTVDPTASSYAVVAIGPHPRARAVAAAWVADAEGRAPTALIVLDDMTDARDRVELADALGRVRTGVRVMVVGGQHDVLIALTAARDAGAMDAELAAFCVHTDDLPVYCAHCHGTHRAEAAPGDEVACPGCGRQLEIHPHFTRALGTFLASDAQAGELAKELAS